jgi:hypothetical protein
MERLENKQDFEDLLTKVIGVLSGSTVGLTTTQIAQSVYGSAGVYPIILVTGVLGCLTAIGTVDFIRAGRARVWTLKDQQRALELMKKPGEKIGGSGA